MVIDFYYDFRSFEHKRVQRAHVHKFKQLKFRYSHIFQSILTYQLQRIKWYYLNYFIIFHGKVSIVLFKKCKHYSNLYTWHTKQTSLIVVNVIKTKNMCISHENSENHKWTEGDAKKINTSWTVQHTF